VTDEELRRSFEDLSLPFSEWTHRAHVRIGYLYLRELPFDAALGRLRSAIKAYNAANNRPDGPLEGYNETTTAAFLRLIEATMLAYGDVMPTPDSESFCDSHPQLLTRHVLRLFYTPERRVHPDAKATFVEPDLAPLPRVPRRS